MADNTVKVWVEPRPAGESGPVEYGFVHFGYRDGRLITRLPFTREKGVQDTVRGGGKLPGFYLDLAYKALDEAGLGIARPVTS